MKLIEINNISKTYVMGTNEVHAIQDVSLEIDKGEFIAIMGPSGSGKSTFMNILGCLDKPTYGNYFLDGIDIIKFNYDKLAEIRNQKIGFVFQGFNLLSKATAIENVELPLIYNNIPKHERRDRAIETLKIVGLQNRENHIPNQLSGGQQQRVAIARAIVNNAPIILADEPTGNLDTKTSCEIMDLFVKLNEESSKTIVLVTHEEDISKYSKRIVRFRDGKIISDNIKSIL